MQVKEIMSSHPEFLSPNTPLAKIAEEMRTHDYGFIPIGENDRLLGVVTDRDLATRGFTKGKDPNTLKAKDIMTKKVLYCFEEDDVEKAAKNMGEQQVHRLVVLNKKKRLTGVLSIGDIARKFKKDELCGRLIEEISEK